MPDFMNKIMPDFTNKIITIPGHRQVKTASNK